jgi:tellurite resistance protein TerC
LIAALSNHLIAAESSGRENFASFDVPWWAWVALIGAITGMLIFDLLAVHKTAHVITIKEAAIESAIWISIGLAFGLVMLWWQGGQAAGEYYAGFLIEKSLSVDNVFVWAVIFSFFAVPRQYQFRVLFWGIFGALVLRAVFIFAGVSLIEKFDWILYVFGAFLLYTAVTTSPSRSTTTRTSPCGSSARSSRRPTSTTVRSCSRWRTPSAWRPRCSPCSC